MSFVLRSNDSFNFPLGLIKYIVIVTYVPSKHAESDPEAFLLRTVMAVTASVQPGSDRIVYAGYDSPHPFQLFLFSFLFFFLSFFFSLGGRG